jgi:hypothetical protein
MTEAAARAVDILMELRRRGVIIEVEGKTLCLKPRSFLDSELLSRVRKCKPEILATLNAGRVFTRSCPTACALSCYEIAPGCWIHHQWDGCKTPAPPPARPPQQVLGECGHCAGTKTCRCIVCANPRTGEASDCVTCKGTGKGWAWLQ